MDKSYFHRGGETPLLGSTISEHFATIASKFPDNEAVISRQQNRRLTYSAFSKEIDRVAKGLLAVGFGREDRIGIWSTNNIEWLLLQMATARIGAVLVNINPAYRIKELAYALKRSEVQGLFVIPSFRSSNYIDMLLELMPQLNTSPSYDLDLNEEFKHLRRLFIYDPSDPEHTKCPASAFGTWQDLLQASENISQQELEEISASLDMDDAINIEYTSGTTGFPKAVVLTHHNILNNAYFSAEAMGLDETDRLCVPVPFYHCFGIVLANLLCFSVGSTLVIACEHFEPLAVLQAIHEERCTAIHGVPTMFIAQLEHPRFSEFDLSSLRTGIMAGAPCSPVLMKKVMELMHCKEILIGYGETEAAPLTHLTLRHDTLEHRIETVGMNLPHQEVKVIDVDSKQIVPYGEVGEVCFRGYHIMLGYYGDEEATAKTVDKNGWLYSGDLGTMDEKGYLRITGRLKDMIIRGGENIYPREIEDHLYTHPKIADVAVFGVPDEYFGEEIMAWIELHEGEEATEDEIRSFCKGQIAHFKIPKFIWFVEEFPMTVTGKIQKFRMREIAMEKMGLS